MNETVKKITVIVMTVILFVGIIPYLLTRIAGQNFSNKKVQVRVLLPDGKIKRLPLEEYLVGVVAAEMPAEFENEALKAQAVAARTYVLRGMEDDNGQNLYDVDTSENTQAWKSNQELFSQWGLLNYFTYHRKIALAVSATEGKILIYNGKKIDAVFFSSCGRKNTEKSNEVWESDVPYLTNVASAETNPLRFVKHQIFDAATFYSKLGFSSIPAQFSASDLIIIERTKAGRVKNLAVRNKIYKGTDFRKKLQIPSTDFEWRIQDNKIELITYGKGHGVGMSQYGANDLAKAGKKYTEILGHYYPGTKLNIIE